jgi:hypothetical protein
MESNDSKRVVGAVEEVVLRSPNGERKVLARIDTGAKLSSLDAKIAEELGLTDATRTQKIRSSHGRSERPVVNVKVVVGGVEHLSEFTVIDRSHMKYQVLIGRNVLENGFLVDASLK